MTPAAGGAISAGSAAEALAAASEAIAAAGAQTPRLDAELLLAAATGIDRARLLARPELELAPAAGRAFAAMVRRRVRREPVAYILGCRGFRHLELAVDRRVLIPRPETELLVEVALEVGPRRVLEVGTGSGAVALAIAAELPGAELVATDTSAAALEVAAANAARLGLAERVRFEPGTLPGGPGGGVAEAGERFDLLVANLPYVAAAEWEQLEPEIRLHEPREALVAGPTGLEAIEALLGELALAAERPGAIALEVGAGQAETVAELVRRAGWETVEARRDLAGIERVVVGR